MTVTDAVAPPPLSTPQLSRWKAARYRLEAVACHVLAWGIPRLSRRACLRLAQVIGNLAYRLDRRGRAVALGNLQCVFGEQYSAAEQQQIIAQSYGNFARTMTDLFWGQRFSQEDARRWVDLENYEEIATRLREEKRGAIFMCLHHGNWEWANLVGPAVDWRLMSVAENFKNPALTKLFQHLREHTGATIIPQESSLIRMLKVVRRGGLTGMLIDLNLRPTQAATVIEAFREDGKSLLMCVPVLHAVLAQRGRALLVPFTTEQRPDGGVHLTLLKPVEPPPEATLQEITQACWASLEPTIQARPGEWLWPYKHFRYRPDDAARPYPAYANASRKFEKLRHMVAAEARRLSSK